MVEERLSKEKFAIKLIKKNTIEQTRTIECVKSEIDIMYKLKCQNIIKLHNHFEDDDKVCLLLEYTSGGTLYD